MSGVTVLVKHPLTRDRYGDVIAGSAPTDEVLPGCWVAPRSATEDNNLRSSTFTGLTVLSPKAADISSSDRLVIPGYAGEWEVDGMPARGDLTGMDFTLGTLIPVKQVTG